MVSGPGVLTYVGSAPMRGPWGYTSPDVDDGSDVTGYVAGAYSAGVTYAVTAGDIDCRYVEPGCMSG